MKNSERKKALMLLLITLGGLTGCSKNENKENNNYEVFPEAVVTTTNTPEPTERPIPTVTQYVLASPTVTPYVTTIPTVIPVQGNLRTCNDYREVKGKNVNVRFSANTDSLILGQVNTGDTCTCLAEYKDWSLVMVGNTIGYIKTSYLTKNYSFDSQYTYEEELDIAYTTSGLYFRLSPEVNDYNKITLIPNKAEVRVIGRTNNGWKIVKYNGKIGFVSGKYLSSLKEKLQSTFPEIKNLEVQGIVSLKRDSSLLYNPNSSAQVVKNFKVYQSAEVLGKSNGYYLVKVDSTVGYINEKDVKKLGNIAVDVNLPGQRLKYYHNNDLIMNTLVSTGAKGTPTPTGLYKIDDMTPGCWFTSEEYGYKVWVERAMHLIDGIYIHDIKNRKMGTPKSHGCISMEPADAFFLYDHVRIGTDVSIHK